MTAEVQDLQERVKKLEAQLTSPFKDEEDITAASEKQTTTTS